MTLAYELMPAHAKVWIYQADRPFTSSESQQILPQLEQFMKQWAAHGRALRAYGAIHHSQFIVLMVDESAHAASGCSIDSSVHFLKQLEQQYGVSLFNRMLFTYVEDGKVKTATRQEFKALAAEGVITNDTIVFNNLVKNKAEMDTQWQIPMGQSWHKRMV